MSLLAIDHGAGTGYLVELCAGQGGPCQRRQQTLAVERDALLERTAASGAEPIDDAGASPRTWQPSLSEREFTRLVAEAQEQIRVGELEEVALSVRLTSRSLGNELPRIYQRLRDINPSPQMYLVDVENLSLVGGTPLMVARVNGDRVIAETDAGTRPVPHGAPAGYEVGWQPSAKEIDEHTHMVTALREDLHGVLDEETVSQTSILEPRRFSHVMHLFAGLEGRLRPDRCAVDVVEALSPHGGVVGLPRKDAMRVIRELERADRGPYGGTIALFGYDGWTEGACVIRSMWTHADDLVMQSGAGIVTDSDARAEYQECLDKAQALIEAAAPRRQR